jgi:hypothetical protein
VTGVGPHLGPLEISIFTVSVSIGNLKPLTGQN